jgi:RNase P/RNase MRP subunit p29
MTLPDARPDPARLDGAFAGEILGARVVLAHPGLAGGPVEGTLIDETMNTFLVRTEPTGRAVRIPKSGASGTIVLLGRPLPLIGEALRLRPEDRTKRLASRGRRH